MATRLPRCGHCGGEGDPERVFQVSVRTGDPCAYCAPDYMCLDCRAERAEALFLCPDCVVTATDVAIKLLTPEQGRQWLARMKSGQ